MFYQKKKKTIEVENEYFLLELELQKVGPVTYFQICQFGIKMEIHGWSCSKNDKKS